MDAQATGGFLRFFDELPDPRAANHVHRLTDLFVIAICAVICGADSWVDVAMFAHAKRAWLSTFLDLAHGVPSHDTFGRVFARIDPAAFERCFGNWMASLKGQHQQQGTRRIAIDGKSIRRSDASRLDDGPVAAPARADHQPMVGASQRGVGGIDARVLRWKAER